MRSAIPFGDKAVTLLHKGADGYQRYALTGCSWSMTNARTIVNGSSVYSAETTCRIPGAQQRPAPGDLIVLGEHIVAAASDIELVRLLELLHVSGVAAFRVQRVKDNRNGPMPHFAATGA